MERIGGRWNVYACHNAHTVISSGLVLHSFLHGCRMKEYWCYLQLFISLGKINIPSNYYTTLFLLWRELARVQRHPIFLSVSWFKMSSDGGINSWAGVMTQNGSTLFKQPRVNRVLPHKSISNLSTKTSRILDLYSCPLESKVNSKGCYLLVTLPKYFPNN